MNNGIDINPGDVFTAGRHKFMCGDIEKDNCCEILDIPHQIYMIYSDPPWNPGNARMWRTVSKLDGASGRKVVWNNFVSRFFDVVTHTNPTHIFIEMGVKQTPEYITTALKAGLPSLRGVWNVFYNYTHPNRLLYFSDANGFSGNLEGMKNEPMTRHVFEHIAKPDEIVFDPCIGLGMTARMAHRFDMTCYGIELNPTRLGRTLMWMSKHGYEIEII